MIKHHQVDKPFAGKVHRHRRRAPLCDKLVPPRVPPKPLGLGRLAWPSDLDGPGSGQARLRAAAGVAIPQHLAPDRVHQHVGQAVVIPVRHGERRVAPLRLARPLNAAVLTGLNPDDPAVGLEAPALRPARPGPAAEIFKKADVTGGVAAHDVIVAVAVPINRHRRGKRAELYARRLLPKKSRRGKKWRAIGHAAGVLDECHPAVLLSNDQVHVAVAVPVDRARHDHLKIHFQFAAVGLPEPLTGEIAGLRPRAGVFKISQPVEKLAADEIQIAVGVVVREVRRGPPVNIHRRAACLDELLGRVNRPRARAGVAHPVNVAVQRAVDPLASGVVGVVPAVLGPVAHADDEIGQGVAVVINEPPDIVANIIRVNVALRKERHRLGKSSFAEAHELAARNQHAIRAANSGDADVAVSPAQPDARLEHRHHAAAARIFKKINAIGRPIRAGHQQIEIAVTVVIHRHGPSPKTNRQVHDQSWVIITKLLQTGWSRAVGCRASSQYHSQKRAAELVRAEKKHGGSLFPK